MTSAWLPGSRAGPEQRLVGVIEELVPDGLWERVEPLLPSGFPPIPDGFDNCGSPGVAAASEGDGPTMAHEIGHALRRLHAPCPATGNPNTDPTNPDPAFPTFVNQQTGANFPSASIGEFGEHRQFHCARPSDAQGRYGKLRPALGVRELAKNGPSVARVDIARRLAEAIWHVLTTSKPFPPAGATPPTLAARRPFPEMHYRSEALPIRPGPPREETTER